MSGPTIADLVALYEHPAASRPYDEAVTEADHAAQAAEQAIADGAPPALVAAALLHDIGHLLGRLVGDVAADEPHEDVGARHLGRHFGPAVTEPVRLHVEAKRYLCTVEPDYAASLSPASVRSLHLQGGPMTPDEVAAFERLPHAADAVVLRRWDDAAKVPGHRGPPVRSHLGVLRSLARP
jgi:gamma-butyrobetaine dioxygenase